LKHSKSININNYNLWFLSKKKGLKFPRQLTTEVFLDSLLSKFSSVVNYNRFHNSAVNYRETFLSFTYVSQPNEICQQQFSITFGHKMSHCINLAPTTLWF